ncbi:PREDICTED: protein phosphatase 2C 37-like [Ipomoea nil]|uniref:protein phosphatase 2C 37-like n=1 Tax=Ipomoea nil TaxID=35883 RepID=UPI000900E893|nr:PREDICTED: protein phosphatase 2C 37-like [Ipomoea nil]
MATKCGGETETSTPVEPSSEGARRRRMEIHQFRFVAADVTVAPPSENGRKRKRVEVSPVYAEGESEEKKVVKKNKDSGSPESVVFGGVTDEARFGITSVCGRRREMEDAVAIRPFFSRKPDGNSNDLHFFGVYDGHGCSHVAVKCRDRMHEIVKGELERGGESTWQETMSRSFSKMDQEVADLPTGAARSSCRCELKSLHCDAGSTAVVAVVTPENIVVSNCGDSRAVLCRNGVAVPLSVDHKPDRPDELKRIQDAGGYVINWDVPRVGGLLAMSRAIGDSYLKPYVTSEPEVTVTERTGDDECLILASDGLWDVVSNETACNVARMCLKNAKPPSPSRSPGSDVTVTATGDSSDDACSDASILLTKLALARHSTDNVSVVVVDLRRHV